MNDLQIIKGINCFIDEQGMVQLKLEDVARGLGFTQIAKSGNEVVRWERVQKYIEEITVPTSGDDGFYPQVGKEDFIPEPIFYLLAMKADNAAAREFQKKVAYEVLPSIRKHGMYATDELLDNPDLLISVATALKAERAKNQQLETEVKVKEQQISELQPKASYYDMILQCSDLLSVSQIAKDYGKSAKWLNSKLHELKIQFMQGEVWLLYQKYADKGYTHSKTQNYNRPDGSQGSKLHTYWTQKGRLFLYELLKRNGTVPTIEREEC